MLSVVQTLVEPCGTIRADPEFIREPSHRDVAADFGFGVAIAAFRPGGQWRLRAGQAGGDSQSAYLVGPREALPSGLRWKLQIREVLLMMMSRTGNFEVADGFRAVNRG